METNSGVQYLLSQVPSAIADHFAFARFVSQAEILCHYEGNLFSELVQSELSKLWFELEIVNANALSDWEDEGRPVVWLDQWTSRYRADASELLAQFVVLLRTAKAAPETLPEL